MVKVSIGIPAYNAANYIAETLDSIIQQREPPPYEVFVVDDCSTDDTNQIVINHPLKPKLYINQKNIGPPANFNKCIEYAQGEYLLILHADDVIEKDFLKDMAEILDKHTNVAMVVCLARIINKLGQIVARQRPPIGFLKQGIVKDAFLKLAILNKLLTPTALVRKDIYKNIGGFNDNFQHTADYDMWMRIALYGQLYFLPKYLARFRAHISSHTYSRKRVMNIQENFDTLISALDSANVCYRLRKNLLAHHTIFFLEIYLELLTRGSETEANEILAILAKYYPGLQNSFYFILYRSFRLLSLPLRKVFFPIAKFVSRGSRLLLQIYILSGIKFKRKNVRDF